MFIHSDLHLADTNQPVAYSGPGETKDVDRIANCNWSPREEKQLVLMFVHRWLDGAKWLTSQGGGGGGSDEPLEPPLDPRLDCGRMYVFLQYTVDWAELIEIKFFSHL